MKSITISVTMPEKLENDLQKEADRIGISRSRFICNLLLEWQKEKGKAFNDCIHQNNGWCNEFDFECTAPQFEVETCAVYEKKK